SGGNSSKVKKPGKVTGVKVKVKKKKLTVSWTKKSGVKGYQLQYALNKKFTKKKKSKPVKKTKITIKKLKQRKTYYFRVCAYKLNGRKKVYGTWSKVKKVKIKR
ncbi:MAG: fibronectin type III domain-containing protein, partial [Lachnospiraceae bacterium]|nr:fibronectin type III domain-containing protein [Lachnospiraceae bacterium]